MHRCQFMGLRGIGNVVIRFKDVFIPKENLLWEEGRGLKLALITLKRRTKKRTETIPDDVPSLAQAIWWMAELGGYTCHAKILESQAFRKATPYNEAFYQSMFMVKDFWAVPEYAELLTAANKRWHPYVVGGKGTAEEASDGLAKDWEAIFKKYKRL